MTIQIKERVPSNHGTLSLCPSKLPQKIFTDSDRVSIQTQAFLLDKNKTVSRQVQMSFPWQDYVEFKKIFPVSNNSYSPRSLIFQIFASV